MPSKLLCLHKSDYGLRCSPLNFYKHLRDRLESKGFNKFSCDYFLFTNDEIMVLFWVEIYMFYAKDDASIDKNNS